MDGLLGATHAAASLLALAHTPNNMQKDLVTPPISRRNSRDAPETPEMSQMDKPSPQRHFVMTGVKRTRDPNMLSVLYSSEGATMVVPLMKHETNNVFFARRRLAADMLFDKARADVYCTWNRSLLNIRVSDANWVKYRETFREQRFTYKNVQLVILRFTCNKHDDSACVNCVQPSRRMSCLTPTLYHYAMPIPNRERFSEELADTALDDFDPICVKKDTQPYTMRIPSIHVRSP